MVVVRGGSGGGGGMVCSCHFGGACVVRIEREKPDLRIGEIKKF